MSQPKFTPGPWEATNLNDPDYFPSVLIGPELKYSDNSGSFRDSITINCGPSPENVKSGKGGGTTMKTANANARLIAAAPALYEALAKARQEFDFVKTGIKGKELLDEMTAALALVESEDA